jgi:hypothetical protein
VERFLIIALPGLLAAQEPTPRRLTPVPLRVDASFATISGARELRDGRFLVSDAKRAALFLVDPTTGVAQQIGSAGGDSLQYAQPGGFYSGLADTTFLLDRGLQRILAISSAGRILASRSIARRGTTSSSSSDVDFQRVDARGLVYFLDQGGFRQRVSGTFTDSSALIRFDAQRQRGDTVTRLRKREARQTRVDERSMIGQDVIGSPQDDWGIAPDGRVAVVRAAPYRVEWYAPNGQVTRGPVIDAEVIPFTTAEREALSATSNRASASGGMIGDVRSSTSNRQILFAETKAPFDLNAVLVAPNGRVWVQRTRPFDATTVIYDVFDERGARVDRVELPVRSRVIGFGAAAIYVNERDAAGQPALKKYKVDR